MFQLSYKPLVSPYLTESFVFAVRVITIIAEKSPLATVAALGYMMGHPGTTSRAIRSIVPFFDCAVPWSIKNYYGGP